MTRPDSGINYAELARIMPQMAGGRQMPKDNLVGDQHDMLLHNPGIPLTPMQEFYARALRTGQLFGVPIRYDDLRERGFPIPSATGNLPDPSLENRWRTHRLTRPTLIQSFEDITSGIQRGRETDFADRLVLDRSVNNYWSVDLTQNVGVQSHFGYNENPVHVRRTEMIADLAEIGIRQALQTKGYAHVLDFGPGIFTMEQAIQTRLNPNERDKVTFIGIDSSEDLLRFGLSGRYIDNGIQTDLSKKNLDDYSTMFPSVDVAIFSELLEHIPHVGERFKETTVPWLQKHEAYIIGSVPNAIKLVDYVSLLSGAGSPHVLRRPIFDSTNDHHSHFTVASLADMLTDFWGCKDAGITSNAVPLDNRSNVCDLAAGLDYPGFGLNLIFWGKFSK